MTEHERLNNHEKFRELCALAYSGALTPGEWAELNGHLLSCEECRELYTEYLILTREGIPLLAARYSHHSECENWDDTAARRKLFARLRAAEEPPIPASPVYEPVTSLPVATQANLRRRIRLNSLVGAALAACLVVAVGFAAYRLGSRARTAARQAQASAEQAQAFVEGRYQKLAAEKQSADELLSAEAKRISQLQQESSQKEQELAKLRVALLAQEDRANGLASAASATDEQLRGVSQERDALNGQLHEAEQAYQKIREEIANIRSERDKAVLQSAALEYRIDEISAVNRDQELRLRRDEQYLAYDRDIRELMGARKLYIADVFDVDSGSRTRKSFGRVFYTEGQSLLFYAFDLDRQAGLKNAKAFQVWGRKGMDQGRPMNLGILYMDSKSKRRWVLRCDDPKQLAEIDAVFVTIEPHGGSPKPTGRPFLYALLRKEANHP